VRILIIVDCYYPGTKSGAKLTRDLGVELTQNGHQVIVLTPSEANQEELEITVEDGVTVLRAKAGKIKGVSKIVRALREMQLSSLLWNKAKGYLRKHPCDLVVYYSPTIFLGPLVKRLRTLWNCSTYLVLRDIFPQWAVDAEVLKKGLAYWYFRFKELQQYKLADVIGVLSPANLQYFAEQPLAKTTSVEVLYNWTLIEEGKSYPVSNYRSSLGLQGKVVFFYGGNIGVAQGMDNIVRLANRLRNEQDIYFLLVGEGSETDRLKGLIRTLGLKNISIQDAVGQDEYLSMLSEFDVGLISLERNLKTHNLPGKMLGYMQFSMPILASINPGNDLSDLLTTSKAGLSSINGDDDILYDQIITLARDADLRKELGQNARRLLDKYFSSSSAANQILAHFIGGTASISRPVDNISENQIALGHRR
jgi:glycosyltransferase involved in cell wall biosynthesis